MGNTPRRRRWLEALGARVIVHSHGSGPLATLQLHLTRLDLGKPQDTGAVDAPVAAVAPEPLRHGGERPQHRCEVAPTEAQIAEHADFWAKLERETRTPEGVAERHGWSVEEATAYLADCAAMEAEAEALPEQERWEYGLQNTLPSALEWIIAFRNGEDLPSRLLRSY